jgi:hypothetical protein
MSKLPGPAKPRFAGWFRGPQRPGEAVSQAEGSPWSEARALPGLSD